MPDHDHPGGEGLDVAFEEDVEPILVQAARDSLELEAWQLEQLAADLLPADLPPHLVEEAVGRLERLEGAATLLAAMAAAGRARELLLPLLFLPLALPVIVGGVGATVEPDAGRYLAFLGLYDALFAILAWATFEYVVTE